jgi:hypothetical protein
VSRFTRDGERLGRPWRIGIERDRFGVSTSDRCQMSLRPIPWMVHQMASSVETAVAPALDAAIDKCIKRLLILWREIDVSCSALRTCATPEMQHRRSGDEHDRAHRDQRPWRAPEYFATGLLSHHSPVRGALTDPC